MFMSIALRRPVSPSRDDLQRGDNACLRCLVPEGRTAEPRDHGHFRRSGIKSRHGRACGVRAADRLRRTPVAAVWENISGYINEPWT